MSKYELMSLREIAAELSVSKGFVEKLFATGALPEPVPTIFVKKRMFRRAEIEQWIRDRQAGTEKSA